jgi:hypothetical protein
MEKVLQFAEECRTLAADFTKPDYKALEIMAHAWEAVAKERQMQLASMEQKR